VLFFLAPKLTAARDQAASPRTAQQGAPTKSAQHVDSAVAEELAIRIADAQSAKNAGNPATVAAANNQLTALALREMGQLRLLESAYPQALELYQRSLDFESLPDTRIDLAVVELAANHPDEAIVDSDKALAAEPANPRGLNVRGEAWIKKREYKKAAEDLERSAQISPDVEILYSLAICLLQTKDGSDKDHAALVFRHMMKIAGDSGSLHVLAGRAYRDANDMRSAIREFQRAVTLDTSTPHAHYFLALARMAVNEWRATPEIKEELSKELKYFPHDYLANYMLGFIASGEREYEVSNRYLKAAVVANPSWPEPWLYMGLNAYAQNEPDRAEPMFRKAIELTGNDESRANFQIRRAYVDLGRILINSDRAKEAEVYLAKARDLQNKILEQGQQNVSAIALAGGAGSAAAIVPLNKQAETEAAPLPPGDTDPFARVDASIMARANLTPQQRSAADAQENQLRGILALSLNDLATSEAIQKKYSAAFGHYQEAERWGPDIPGLAKNLGLSAFRVDNYAEAIRGLSRALEEKPEDGPVRAMLGMSYFGSEKYVDAARVFSPLGKPGMQDASVGYAWAASLAHSNDLKQASDVLTEFENIARPNDVLLLVGQLWIEIGDYSRAVKTLNFAINADPALPKAHYYIGQAEIRSEHWPEATAEFEAELKLNPLDVDAKYNLGFVLLQKSKIEDATALFQEVVGSHPNYANAQYQLGKILLDRGKVKDAIDHLELAMHSMPESDYIHYQLQAAYRKQSRFADADRELAIYKELKSKKRDRIQSAIPAPN
jgi:tetratricopeptide (TPR) repeat protein